MYLHVGNNRNIRLRDVIGIFDADSATVSAITKKYLSAAEAKGLLQFASLELPKSFLVYRDGKGACRVCFSQLSTQALAGRIEGGIMGTFE